MLLRARRDERSFGKEDRGRKQKAEETTSTYAGAAGVRQLRDVTWEELPSLSAGRRLLFILGLLLLRCLAVAIVESNDVARNPTRHQSCRALDENNWNLRSSRSKTIRGGFAGCVTALSVLEKLRIDAPPPYFEGTLERKLNQGWEPSRS